MAKGDRGDRDLPPFVSLDFGLPKSGNSLWRTLGNVTSTKQKQNFTEGSMRFGQFLGIAVLLVVLWAAGFIFFHVAGFLIHLLLLFAVISLIVHFFTAAKPA